MSNSVALNVMDEAAALLSTCQYQVSFL